ncbi:EfeM/EfeO family lipoprotein [Paenibacillus sp. PsM32]|uniref:EfeM/EfeO family lipoprotein n=1 Tax=Paenibacillus kyungheensis TaxID=1452732 RepID=A0AAX3LZU4_9BACL|nr:MULTISPECIES: iron uptake system protein EfeO [Paenibacillus]MDN4619786.1 EfeM/EfeO family lipoprotein [Paenibacillus sp. PsM32]MDQ1235423.1 iron uptake system component EfeO [Paenibacillus sp. SORGH_AS_0306]MDR6112472.1 iron uptake system component EfeO [Paenibacillus sp. SORGH_AS_0338]WCT54959.1 EfeM/EfeO family lipoprotein [Paenibacillus kyungheensis]WDF51896.1 EfeM/EfeO family lipoprotein [Paenibacillus sp. KACC 21273]
MKARVTLPATILLSSVLFTACGNQAPTNTTAAPATTEATTTESTTATPSTESTTASTADFKNETEQYRTYAIGEIDSFVTETEKFTAAVKAGKLKEAQALYAPARMHYERIEPIAEALGNLDPDIDARAGDVDDKDWRGFHKIEQALWEKKTTDGMSEYADRLLQDAQLLRAKVETVDIDASMLVVGAVELLNEVSSSKITGEEERYSHTDLYDFVANVEGAEKIYDILKPRLAEKDADLEKQIGERFEALNKELAPFATKDGGYVTYDKLTKEDIRTLSQNLDALAEPLSQMGTILGV